MRVADVKAPGIIPRRSVHEPMATGLKAVDAMIPIGRGQRELLIGDRQTGKSAIILDTILNQKVYNEAAGRRRGQEALLRLRRHRAEALDRAPVRAPPRGDGRDGLLHRRGRDRLGPRADAVPGALFGDRHGGILPRQRPPRRDLLRRPVQAGRGLPQMSLLLRRPPGREAYPGDVFYLHSRLLERSAKLNADNGSGSLTALPSWRRRPATSRPTSRPT
jgi:F-type H+-transporting ATPase subunit alpha